MFTQRNGAVHHRLTRDPLIEVSTSMATQLRLQSSTMFRHRMRRPSARPSETKSIGQLKFAAAGVLLRPPSRHNVGNTEHTRHD
jgi:hypothetical protein